MVLAVDRAHLLEQRTEARNLFTRVLVMGGVDVDNQIAQRFPLPVMAGSEVAITVASMFSMNRATAMISGIMRSCLMDSGAA